MTPATCLFVLSSHRWLAVLFPLSLGLTLRSGPPAECLRQPPRRPPVPATFAFPVPEAGDTITFAQDTGSTFYANLAGLHFRKSASATQVCAIFVKYDATIIGGLPNSPEYIVRFPRRRITWEAWMARLDSLNAEPALEYAGSVSWKTQFTAK